MIPYSRPKLSDLYTLFQIKLLEKYTLRSGTYQYIPYMAVPPPPPRGHPHPISSSCCIRVKALKPTLVNTKAIWF